MLIDCGQCEFRAVACGDCLVTALVENGANPTGERKSERGRNKDVSNGDVRRKRGDIAAIPRRVAGAMDHAYGPGGRPGRHAFGALELRGLSTLASAGLVPPLRYRSANKATREIVAL
jgi:hypothetical protein